MHPYVEIEISRKPSDGKVKQIFFDPTGRHLIITTDHGENYYLYEKWRRTKQLPKFKVIKVLAHSDDIHIYILGCDDHFNRMEQTSNINRPIHPGNLDRYQKWSYL